MAAVKIAAFIIGLIMFCVCYILDRENITWGDAIVYMIGSLLISCLIADIVVCFLE